MHIVESESDLKNMNPAPLPNAPIFGPTTSWGEFAEHCFEASRAKGWWPEADLRNIREGLSDLNAEKRVLVISEIIEAFEAARNGDPLDTWYTVGDNPKPEGVLSELADVVIRLGDLDGAIGTTGDMTGSAMIGGNAVARVPSDKRVRTVREFAALCSELIDFVSRGDGVSGAYACFQLAARCGADLWPAINAKLAYNATRPQRHGGKLA